MVPVTPGYSPQLMSEYFLSSSGESRKFSALLSLKSFTKEWALGSRTAPKVLGLANTHGIRNKTLVKF
jgi:hypothetical protein